MASEIRVNKIINRSGLSTVTFSDTGAIVSGIVTANSFSGNVTGNVTGSGANLTSIPAGQLTGTVADARLTSVTASKLSGALPAIDGSSLTGINTAFGSGTSVNTSGIITATAFVPTTQGSLSHRNLIINGGMSVSQRHGTSETTPAHTEFGPDRMRFDLSQSSKFKVQQVTDAPAGFSHSMKVTSLSAYSSGANDYFLLQNMIEGTDSARLNWGTSDAQTVTLSFYVKSSLTGVHACGIRNNGYNRANTQTYTINNANTWERKTVTFTGDTSGSWNVDTNAGLKLNFDLGSGSSFQAASTGTWLATNDFITSNSVKVVGTNAATWYITGVQLEVGPVETPFEHRSFGDELRRCQRYYQQLRGALTGVGANSTTIRANYAPIVNFRASPTITGSNPVTFNNPGINSPTQSSFDCGLVYTYQPTKIGMVLNFGNFTNATNQYTYLQWDGNSDYIFLDAEL